MTKRSEVKFNLTGLEDIKRKVGDTYRARVGVLGINAARSGETSKSLNNSSLMMIQMFGSITNKIPPRDPLFQPLIRHRRDLMQKLGSGAMRQAFAAGEFKRMFALLGVAAEEIVQNAFETSGDGTWANNAEITIHGGWMKNKVSGKPVYIKGKGSSRPLIDTGQLRRAVTSDVVKKSDAKGARVSVGAV
jgi:hypothetical protein